jgi:multidrug efflux pump
MEDRSFISVMVNGHEGASFEYMDEKMDEIRLQVAKEVPEIQELMSITSPGWMANTNTGLLRILLKDPKERSRSQAQIAQDLQKKIASIQGVSIRVTQDPTIRVGPRSGLPVQIIVQSTSLERLREVLPGLVSEARNDPAFSFVDSDLKFSKPQLDLHFNRDMMSNLHLDPMLIGQNLQLALSGGRYGYFIRNGKQYQVFGELDSLYKLSPRSLDNFYIRNYVGDLIRATQVFSFEERAVPPELYRFNRYVAATISANPAPGVALGDAISNMQGLAREHLGSEFSTELGGSSRDFSESSGSLMQILILALILVYMILAAQFESFRYPFIIMLTVPLALFGALFTLWIFGFTLNLFSQIGLVMLIGLVTKNGILIVEFANQKRRQGLDVENAVISAAVSRLRPILMTSLATIFGFLPIVFSFGAGAESRVPMGAAVIGGLIFSLALTLIVIPTMYSLFAPKEVDDNEI